MANPNRYIIHRANITVETTVKWQNMQTVQDWVKGFLLEEFEILLNELVSKENWITLEKWELQIDMQGIGELFSENGTNGNWKQQLRKQVLERLQTAKPETKTWQVQKAENWSFYLVHGYFKSTFAHDEIVNAYSLVEVAESLPANSFAAWRNALKDSGAMQRFLSLSPSTQWALHFLTKDQAGITHFGLDFPRAWLPLANWMQKRNFSTHPLLLNILKYQPSQIRDILLDTFREIQVLEQSFETLPKNWQKPIEEVTREINIGNLPENKPQKNNESKAKKGIPKSLEIQCAGLVLIAPFLPRYFEALGYKPGHSSWQQEVPMLIYYLATGQSKADEWNLVLGKILGGIPLSTFCKTEIVITEAIEAETNQLLNSAIEHWGALKNTSPDGLRVNFLQREGRLTETDEEIHIEISEQAPDILLRFIPWNFRMIKLAWMEKIIIVKWGN